MRLAYLITEGGLRGDYSTRVLESFNFRVQHVHPVSTEAAQAYMALHHIKQKHMDRAVSNMLTQCQVWTLTSNASYVYIFEDDIEFPKIAPPWMHKQLDFAEATNSDIIYLGSCAEHRKNKLSNLLWSRCAALCAHAYGINTARSSELATRMKKTASRQGSTYYKTNWDVVMRGHYVHSVRNVSLWPICAFPNIFVQNRTRFISTIPSLSK